MTARRASILLGLVILGLLTFLRRPVPELISPHAPPGPARPGAPALAGTPRHADGTGPAPARRSAPGLGTRSQPIAAATAPGPARFCLRDGNVTAFFTPDGVRLALHARQEDRVRGWGLDWGVSGAVPVEPTPVDELPGRLHSIVGDPADWRVDQPTYSGLRYPRVAPGIDLLLESRPHGLEYSLRASPGTDPASLRFRYDGALELVVADDGASLEVVTGLGVLREHGLLCFQKGRRVEARYASCGPFEYSIELRGYDPSLPLVIDPLLDWSTFLGGNLDPGQVGGDDASSVAVDGSGNVYVAGHATAADFPATGGFDRQMDTFGDGFVTKISGAGPGAVILWSTFIGSDEYDSVEGIALDSAGDVYLCGITNGANFPTTGGFDTTFAGGDGFVAKLSSGGALVWSSYLGGTQREFARAIAVDGSGNAYVTGETPSADFSATGGFDGTLGGSVDAFVVKVNATGSSLDWGSYLGGAADDFGYGISVDASGNVFVTGKTASVDFPNNGAFDAAKSGVFDGFVTKVSATGNSLAWSSYLGGSNDDLGRAIAVDGGGNVFVTGEVASTDFPSANGFDTTANGNWDAFVTKISDGGTSASIAWSSYLGGSTTDFGYAIAVRGTLVYVGGVTYSSDFPASNGFDTTLGGFIDAFVAKIDASGTPPTLVWSSYLGGSSDDRVYGVAPDAAGSVILAGHTFSVDFPAAGGFDSTLGGGADAFVTKVDGVSLPAALTWSTYLGGAAGPAQDLGNAIAVDGGGSVYVVGTTTAMDFPTTAGAYDTTYVSSEAFVTKYTPSGIVVWSTFLGGSSFDFGHAVAVDGSGQVHVGGRTTSFDFPVVGGFQGTLLGSADAFVAKLAPDGASLAWSTLLGGVGDEGCSALAVDGAGSVYVVGTTYSPSFPTPNGFDTFLSGPYEGYLTKIAVAGNSILWSTFIGGSGIDTLSDLVLDGQGNVYVAGSTTSTDLSVPGGFDTTLSGAQDGFMMRVNAAGGSNPSVGWATYLGGTNSETITSIARDPWGNLYVAGQTGSNDFPAAGGFDTSFGGGTYDGFVSKINDAGASSMLTWSSYLGGNGVEHCSGVAVDSAGDPHLTGGTTSTDFPLLDAFDTTVASYDAFVTKVRADGTGLLWSSYLGGSAWDVGNAVALDPSGKTFVTGETRSSDFPVPSGFDTSLNAATNAFVTKIASVSAPPPGGGGGGGGGDGSGGGGGCGSCGASGIEALLLAWLARRRRVRRER